MTVAQILGRSIADPCKGDGLGTDIAAEMTEDADPCLLITQLLHEADATLGPRRARARASAVQCRPRFFFTRPRRQHLGSRPEQRPNRPVNTSARSPLR